MHCGDQGRQFPVQDEQPRIRNRPAVRRVALSETKPAPTSEFPSKLMQPKNLLILLGALFFASIAPAESSAATAATGTLSGSVSNAATGNLLAGAAVEVPALGRRVVTDPSGRYLLSELPAGTHEIVVSYLGLDSVRERLVVAAERTTRRDFELTTAIYQLDAFKVVGEREGSAAAITEKRNAGNVKDVVAMDQFGNLPNLSTGEVVMRLPGVAGSPSDEGISGRFMTRGMDAALNTVTVDGSQMTTQGLARNASLGNVNATMFEAVELIKGQTPDKGADSLGGTLNLKTRSPLTMREKRRTTYNFVARIAPSFFEQTPQREQHRSHPLMTLAHQEVFDVLGGSRNLGVALNLSYCEYAIGGASSLFDYQNTTAPDAYIWDFSTWDNINNRKQMSLNLKTEYRWSSTTKLTFGWISNLNFERFRHVREVRAFTGTATTVPNATTTGVVPGAYTAARTVVRPVAAANIDITSRGPIQYNVRMRQAELGAEHDYGRLRIDYNAAAALTSVNDTQGIAGSLTMRLSGAGWIVDRSQSDMFPQFLPNGGPDFTNPDNYRPIANGLTNTNNQQDQSLKQARLNLRYQLPVSIPLWFKAGGAWRDQAVDTWGKDNHRWSYIGGRPLASDPSYVSYNQAQTGRLMPQWLPQMYINDRRPRDAALWSEDRYYHESQKFTLTRGVSEAVTAGYVMTEGKVGRTGFLGGVRVEDTATDSWGWVRARQLSTVPQQTADPVGAAARDYAANYREIHGRYAKWFPSVHAFHDLTANLKARLSWSTSFGRAALNEFLPAETPDEANQRVTINNPGLKPQTASNWDAMIEYYFEPVGSFTVGWFHKTIQDYILRGQEVGIIGSGADNGFNGEYAGWSERTSVNAGTAVAQGWELAYQQQFTFLPGWLKGLAASANYTRLVTHGNYGGTTYLTSRELPSFVPYTANASLSWRYRKFSTRVLYNFTGEHITSYNATSPALNLYRQSNKTVNFGMAYQVRPSLNLSLDVANLFNEPQVLYRGFKDRAQRTLYNFVTITAGVNGRF
jgi:TonB-dependent receptor